jgi:hypothetical protein
MSIDSSNNKNKANMEIRGTGIIPITSGTLKTNKFTFSAAKSKVNQIINTDMSLTDVLNLKYLGSKYPTPPLSLRDRTDLVKPKPLLI